MNRKLGERYLSCCPNRYATFKDFSEEIFITYITILPVRVCNPTHFYFSLIVGIQRTAMKLCYAELADHEPRYITVHTTILSKIVMNLENVFFLGYVQFEKPSIDLKINESLNG